MRSFPFDTLKIDRTFICAIETHEETAAIVRGIISLASSLGVSITAEGVETQGQYDFLAAFGCAEVQGYLISRPVPANEVSGLIERLSGQLAWA
jgi:EAL domain-containing protein (putative c-di-GMP-specific phosphodiesterase class I)